MRVTVIKAFLQKKAELSFTKKLAFGILDEIKTLCSSLKGVAGNASILLDDVDFIRQKISQTDSDEEIKLRMSNLRDQVSLRVDFMRDDVHTSVGRKVLKKLDVFVYKTS